LVIAEVHFLRNLHERDSALRAQYLDEGRALLRRAELMRARCVLGFAGSAHPSGDTRMPHPDNFTDSFKDELAGHIRELLDGLELRATTYALEASNKSFFFGPEGCAALVDAVDDPRFGIHLDMMNMVSQSTYFSTTALIDRTFELLGGHIVAAHLKDVWWDADHHVLKFDEVAVGDGVMDYPALVRRLATFDEDFPCLCEHLDTKEDYVRGFQRLHEIAAELGTPFVGRGPLSRRS
jgi:sugar phosphate isomerase/epimerase